MTFQPISRSIYYTPTGYSKPAQPSKKNAPFNGDEYLNLFKTLAVDSPASLIESEKKATAIYLSGLAHIHEEDEGEVLKALASMPVSPVELARRALGDSSNIQVSEPCLPALESFHGEYQVAPGSGYVSTSYKIEPQDVISASETTPYLEKVRSQVESEGSGESRVATYLVLKKKNVTFKKNFLGYFFKWLPGKVFYVFSISTNGVVRFHLPPERWMLTKLVFLIADSERGTFSWLKNLWHAIKHGCYCIGLCLSAKPEDGAENTSERPVIMRFNRWNADVAPYWAAVRTERKEKAGTVK